MVNKICIWIDLVDEFEKKMEAIDRYDKSQLFVYLTSNLKIELKCVFSDFDEKFA